MVNPKPIPAFWSGCFARAVAGGAGCVQHRCVKRIDALLSLLRALLRPGACMRQSEAPFGQKP